LVDTAGQKTEHPPTLIFTGATASVKANALVSQFNVAKFGLRALTSALAKEFGPKGVHVSHAVIDGVIDTPRAKEYFKDAGPDAKILPEGVRITMSTLCTDTNGGYRLRMHTGICILSPGQPLHGRLTFDHMWRNGRPIANARQ
jgi:NAD(P)-dependent dehydrogenase (short-subunit alcohol dehydrogenase family)